MTPPAAVKLIAIVGGSGAGKGWLVARLCEFLGDLACHLELDNFYRDRSHLAPGRRARLNFDVPRAIDWEEACRTLRDARVGAATVVPQYDFSSYTRTSRAEPWTPRPLVLVDGLWLLHSPRVRRMFDLSIYLDTPPDLRHARRLARDLAERGYTAEDVEQRYQTAVAPMHERYVEPQKKWADLILPEPFQEPGLRQLADHLWTLVLDSELAPITQHRRFCSELHALLSNHECRN